MRQHTVTTPYMVGEVHFYTAETERGLALFDTGPPTREGELALCSSVDLSRLKYLFISHCHVDHYGLVNFILDNSSADVYIPRQDAIKLERHDERIAGITRLLLDCGFSKKFVLGLRDSYQAHKVFPERPRWYRVVEESPEIAELGIEWFAAPGHSQSDLVYLTGDCAVTGDLLLRNIFQAPLLDIDLDNFSRRFRNYDAYCDSLVKLATLRGKRIMPGHRDSVDGVDEAIVFYVTTLLERSARLLPYRGIPVAEMVDRIFQGRITDPFHLYLKASEMVFMLDFIEQPSQLRSSLERIGLFDRVAEPFNVVAAG
ncbi:MBL fold metallo-hydrolase [Geomonas sp. Red32]|uniref:MBL fold metallo-hydrolase n=1 Tax=Geomonas sp. Red32 TaxID=2912856 RepID=UPI00202D04D8|nr:MBL fold metallo-hydrolase [Geomonas sp. Red32]MCM0082164.1 MBL fold metallo-hydrolase [Geomonas sp. Red32]